MRDPHPRCRGCESADLMVVHEYAYEDVWASIEQHVQLVAPRDLRESLTPAATVRLYRCNECLTDSFHPALAGDSEFYAWLSMSEVYYEGTRWEFGVVAAQLREGQPVVDVGCGPGGFIRMALDRGANAVGVDENPRARAAVSQLGAASHASTADAAQSGPYEVVTAFQVVEHVERAQDMLQELASLASSGGHVFVSVPNRDRLGAGPLRGLDYPPHHLTRWSPRALVEVGRRAGLEAAGASRERPHPSLVRETVEDRLSDVPGLAPVADTLARLAVNRRTAPWITALGVDRRMGWYGHTILVHYRHVD